MLLFLLCFSSAFGRDMTISASDLSVTAFQAGREQISMQLSVPTSSGSATVHCGAFTAGQNVTALTIRNQQHHEITSAASVTVNITNLIPATDYSVYCYAARTGEPTTPLATILNTLTAASTACCRELRVSMSVLETLQDTPALPQAIALSVDNPPSESFDAEITFLTTGDVAPCATFPMSVTFSSSSVGTQMVTLTTGGAGEHQLLVTLSGASAAAYEVVYYSSRIFTVISSHVDPAVPVALQAVFSNDGGSVALTFDSPTDQGGFANIFPCTQLLSFAGDSTATCVWSDAATAVVYPKYSGSASETLNVGQNLTVIANKIRAFCASDALPENCVNYVKVGRSPVEVRAPFSLVLPTVLISAPRTLDACSALTVDLTTSSGAAGRPWVTPSFVVVTASGATAEARQLQNFFNRNYTLNPPTPVPSSLFAKNQVYTIQPRLCNFLGACNTAVAVVNVTTSTTSVPVVSLLGGRSRNTNRYSQLVVNSNAFIQSCANTISSAGLDYAWTVRTVLAGGEYGTTSLRTTSQSPAVFRLPPFSLLVGTTYQVTLTVTTARQATASASTTVVVVAGKLFAQIAGGSPKYMILGDSIVLDASKSYDEDKTGVTGASAGLNFFWSCVRQAPIFSSACPLTIAGTNQHRLNVSAVNIPINTTALFTVRVSDATRSATAQTTIVISGSRKPELSISSSSGRTNINTGRSFVLNGQVKIAAPCQARWSLNDAGVSLASVASTALTRTLQPASASVPVAFNLVINAGALPQRASLSFTLSCDGTSTSFAVTTNGAPLPGQFIVTPKSGRELSDLFSFSALQWTDSDLPLTYQFGFVSETSLANLVVVSKSELAFTSTTLPSGLPLQNNLRNCTLDVFDNMNAFTSVLTEVTVLSASDEQKDMFLLDLIQSNTGSVDSTKNILSVVSTALNAVNCTMAPNCTALFRSSCVRTSGECGPCIGGYIGDAGDRSTLCIPASIATLPSSSLVCKKNNDCPAHTTCDTDSNTCVTALKQCSQDCSGHGKCIFLSKTSGEETKKCRLANTDCDAVCSCDTSYSGDFCQLNDAALQNRRAVRSNLVGSLANLTRIDDINAQSVGAWSASLYSLSLKPHELSTNDVKLVAEIANATLYNAIALQVDSFADIAGVLQATDTLASLVRYNYNPNDYKDADFGGARVYDNNTAALTVQTVSSFANLVSQAMVLGQNTTSFLYDNFRMSVTLSEVTGSDITYATPEAATESEAGVMPSTAAIAPYYSDDESVAGPSALAVKVISVPPRSFSYDTSAFVSTPLMIQIQPQGTVDSQDPSTYLSTIEFTLQNNNPRKDFVEPGTLNITTVCVPENLGTTFTSACPGSDAIVVHTCKLPGTHVSFCPVQTPTCAKLDVNTAEFSLLSSCEVIDFNTTYTKCLCQVASTAESRKLQGTTEQSLLDDTGATCMMTSTIYIAANFVDTFDASNQFSSPADAARVIVVIVMLGLIWGSGIFVVSYEGLMTKVKERKKSLTHEHIEVQKQRIVMNYVESVIPRVFREGGSMSMRIWAEVVEHHVVFKLMSKQTPKKRREIIFKTMSVFTFMLFLLAIFFDVSNPGDDGTCKTLMNEEDCLNRVSPFDSAQNFCKWQDDYQTCAYNSESMTIDAMFYLTVLTTVMTAIATIPLEYLFSIMAAPTARDLESAKVDAVYTSLQSGARRLSAVGIKARNTVMPVQKAPEPVDNKPKSFLHRLTVSEKVVANRDISEDIVHIGEAARKEINTVIKKNQAITLQAKVSAKTMATKSSRRLHRMQSMRSSTPISRKEVELRAAETADAMQAINPRQASGVALYQELLQQRVLMNDDADETKLFDAQWGIFKDESPNATNLYFIDSMARITLAQECFETTEEAAVLSADLGQYSIHHAGLEMLHLFMVDLLGRHTPAARIFREKFGEEFEDSHAVQLWQKYFCGLLLLGLNGFFIYFVLLKALQKGLEWQLQFLVCFILQFLVEVLIFETMECVWLNYSVPSFVRKEVEVALDKLRAQVDLVAPTTDVHKEIMPTYLVNGPAHLFVSVKVAKAHPELLESMIVGCYTHHLPGEICRTWEHYQPYMAAEAKHNLDEQWADWGPWVRPWLRGLSLSIQMFITIPYLYQRVTIRFVQPMIISAITIAWFYATSSPVAIGIMCGLVVVMACFFAWRYYLAKHGMLTVTPDETEKELLNLVPTFVEDDEDGESHSDSDSTQQSGSTQRSRTNRHGNAKKQASSKTASQSFKGKSQKPFNKGTSAGDSKSGDESNDFDHAVGFDSKNQLGELHKPASDYCSSISMDKNDRLRNAIDYATESDNDDDDELEAKKGGIGRRDEISIASSGSEMYAYLPGDDSDSEL